MMQRYGVYLMDESGPNWSVKNMGCGFRIVSAVVGRKWVRLACRGGRGKMPVDKWAALMRSSRTIVMPERKRRRRE